ncbi:MAG: alpha-1,2-fucosyltransferase [Candidatus Paceibacterota bacterium]
MIIVRIHGGLGNQLFQYCLGRNLALRNRTKLKFDTSFFDKSVDRRFLLDKFNTSGEVASVNEINKIKPDDIFHKVFNKIIPNKNIVNEKSYDFDKKILELKDNIYLSGVWPSEKYFDGIEDVLRREITLKKTLGKEASVVAEKIKLLYNPISIHIRRGDYVTNEKFSKVHGTCDPEYYEKAIKFFQEKIGPSSFFVFSDDIPWVKVNISLPQNSILVSKKEIFDYEELILMSMCKNHIIANSTFSWWGAWLNNNPEKIVIAPKDWFADSVRNSKDLIPESWITI